MRAKPKAFIAAPQDWESRLVHQMRFPSALVLGANRLAFDREGGRNPDGLSREALRFPAWASPISGAQRRSAIDVFERSSGFGKVAAVENLDPRVMLSVEGSYRARATRLDDILWVVEP
jgi:hypothetical protein